METNCTGEKVKKERNDEILLIQARMAQLVAYQLGTGEVPGSNPGNGENFSMKICK